MQAIIDSRLALRVTVTAHSDYPNGAHWQHPAASGADRLHRSVREGPGHATGARSRNTTRRSATPFECFEATGSPVISDGEQTKYHNFATYPVHGLANFAPDGFKIPFAAGHFRQLPRLTGGPPPLRASAPTPFWTWLSTCPCPVKQAVISPSALSLLYPADDIPGYSREEFIEDLLREHETDVRSCLRKGRDSSNRFHGGAPGRETGPVRKPLSSFIEMNNITWTISQPTIASASACTPARRRPRFDTQRGRGLRRAAAEPVRVERREFLYRAGGRDGPCPRAEDHSPVPEAGSDSVFVGVIAPLDPRIESPEEVATASRSGAVIPIHQLGTTDDCGFAPFCDDRSTSRATAFAKIRARVAGTALAGEALEREGR